MKYSELTINDPNFIKRFLQRYRFKTAISLFDKYVAKKPKHILDYGAGSAQLIKELIEKIKQENKYYVYEPTKYLMDEAKDNLVDLNYNEIHFFDNSNFIKSNEIDVLFCLEVFEHLPKEEINNVISDIKKLITQDGIAIIGVPIEIGIPALYKGIFRMTRRYGEYDACIRNVVLSLLYSPPSNRPTREITDGFKYHRHHVGFDLRTLFDKFNKEFTIIDMRSSPFSFLGRFINPEYYFVLKKS